jgi:hypothetical protein
MNFKEAWKAVGHTGASQTTWSANVDGKPVFTAWYDRDIKWDKDKKKTVYHSVPSGQIESGTSRTYIERARDALERGLDCRLILLQHPEGNPHKVKSAHFDERFWCVRFTKVHDDGLIEGELIAKES